MTSSLLKTCATLAAATALLAACGGGNNDEPTPSNQPGVLTVAGATRAELNGVYGNGTLNLTNVEKNNPVGSYPEVCAFKFNGADRVGSAGTALGDIRYRPDATGIYEVFLTFNGREFTSKDPVDSAVVRTSNEVRLSNKTLTATDGSLNTVRVSGLIPLRGNRPLGC